MGWIIAAGILLLVILFLVFWCAVFRVSSEVWDEQEKLFEQQLLNERDNRTDNAKSHHAQDNKSEQPESTDNAHRAFEIKEAQ